MTLMRGPRGGDAPVPGCGRRSCGECLPEGCEGSRAVLGAVVPLGGRGVEVDQAKAVVSPGTLV